MVTPKFHIENRSSVSDFRLFELVMRVISQGLLSNNCTEYCYLTSLGSIHGDVYYVQTIKTKYGYRIIVTEHKIGRENEEM